MSNAVAHKLENADRQEGLDAAGHQALTTEAGGVGPENHPDPSVFGLDATVWVSLSMLVFLAVLVWKGVPRAIGGMLDRQIAAIRNRLEEAKKLRAEAEALRDEYSRKLADVENQTAAMVEHARGEAAALIAKAEADAADLVARRGRMAEDKIAAAERAALAEVRARVASAATAAAASLIAAKHDAGADKALVDRTIGGLGRLN